MPRPSELSNPELYAALGEIMRSEEVRGILSDVADQLQKIAQAPLDPEDAAEITREDGTRPGTKSPEGAIRPYSRVSAPVSWEFGGPNQTRLRLLGTAVEKL